MSDRLKVCKRCGTYASVQEITDTRGERLFYRVRCDNPICDEVSRLHKTIDEAVAEWNDPTTKDDLRAELAAKDAEIDRLRGAFIELIHRVNVWGSKTAGQSLPVELSDAIFQADLAVTQKQEGGAQ